MNNIQTFDELWMSVSASAQKGVVKRCASLLTHFELEVDARTLKEFEKVIIENHAFTWEQKTGILHLAIFGRYPKEADLRKWSFLGGTYLKGSLLDLFVSQGAHTIVSQIECSEFIGLVSVAKNNILVDISQTYEFPFLTGIQRVVKELLKSWISAEYPFDSFVVHPATCSPVLIEKNALKAYLFREQGTSDHSGPKHSSWVQFFITHLDPEMIRLLRPVKNYLAKGLRDLFSGFRGPGQKTASKVPILFSANILLPEVSGPESIEFFSVLYLMGCPKFSMIVYDLIPVFSPEYCTITDSFMRHLTLIRFADHISCISQATEEKCRVFCQGVEHKKNLKITSHALASAFSRQVNSTVGQELSSIPLILSVGTVEPRKNHLGILRAALLLKLQGYQFRLVIVGNLGWLSESFTDELSSVKARGVEVEWINGASDEKLRELFRETKFTVFVPFVEGYGLPIIESLSFGKPCITSDRGSMSEVAAAGGCLLVNPASAESIAEGMRVLLTDTARYEKLRCEIDEIKFKGWKEYGDEIYGMVSTKP